MIGLRMRSMHKPIRRSGFTLVELTVVIAILAILAVVSFVAYRGIQDRARDTQRITDMTNIAKVLEVYKGSNKAYPNEQSSNWEMSTAYPNDFIKLLTTSGLTKRIPVDPINDSRHYYRYYLYSAGGNCDASKGPYYILQVVNLDKASSNKPKDNPGFTCASRNWTNEAWYTTGGYLSD